MFMDSKYSTFQKCYILWMTFFTVLCFVNSVLVIKFDYFDFNAEVFAFLLPFVHVGIIIVCSMVYVMFRWCRDSFIGDDEQYIKSNYPDVWKKLRPWGDTSHNGFTTLRFIKGKYDDGTDDRLNLIKSKYIIRQNLIGWPFLLILVVWIFNFVLIFSSLENQ